MTHINNKFALVCILITLAILVVTQGSESKRTVAYAIDDGISIVDYADCSLLSDLIDDGIDEIKFKQENNEPVESDMISSLYGKFTYYQSYCTQDIFRNPVALDIVCKSAPTNSWCTLIKSRLSVN